ncbi:MAG: TauD/TfdA family dioxygenase [Myxococcales bacterium]|nr:TauD/TfdA family dioxygenase [Myxococcales bacterium]
MHAPRVLEASAQWYHDEVADPSVYIEEFDASELEEIDVALANVRGRIDDLLNVSKADFQLAGLAERLGHIERELIDGRGFVVLRGLPRDRYDNDEMCLIYWGIGMHLGKPWAQNKRGHMLGDVTDQGKPASDPTSRGNEVGSIALPYHSDGSDLVGLLCLQDGVEGGRSTVCNALAIHNDLLQEAPELVAELYEPQPHDFRGEHRKGGKPYYMVPVFTESADRLFVRYIRPYILASQRHPEAPRITETAERAMQRIDAMTQEPRYQVMMDFRPGDMQFINNYHVLHGRTAYRDDPSKGRVRHLKRLWLETEGLEQRPPHFQNNSRSHWEQARSVSRLDRPG